jgi:hypothetical protein
MMGSRQGGGAALTSACRAWSAARATCGIGYKAVPTHSLEKQETHTSSRLLTVPHCRVLTSLLTSDAIEMTQLSSMSSRWGVCNSLPWC